MDYYLNGQNMKMIKVSGGTFMMGGESDGNTEALPRHLVTLSSDFYISETPVTLEQFRKFEEEQYGRTVRRESYRGYVIGVSYEEAEAYLKWLSKKEGKVYRLPTEAEWEFTARQTGMIPVDRMCDPGFREWCYDWYAPYSDRPVIDPAGPVDGMFRCVRGGYLDNPERYNCFPTNPFFRGSLPPGYRHIAEDQWNDFGKHSVGFRAVCGNWAVPSGKQKRSLIRMGVRKNTPEQICAAPTETIPYFRKRFLLPVPPDNCTQKEQLLGGMPQGFRHHHHSPALTVAPNGDLICSVYSTFHEYDAESGLIGMRLRVGEEEWSFPDEFLNAAGINDHAPLMYTASNGKIYHFWGWPQLDHAYPFQYTISDDFGESWGEVQFPLFCEKAEYVCRQPVNTCIEAKDGTFYLAADADARREIDDTGIQNLGASSVLWRSRDGMKTWENPKARTAGRHTTAVELSNGELYALGGKNTDIDGFMPVAVSKDRGDSYLIKKTPFPAMNSGQRPSILRLSSGRLVVCGDYQTKKNVKPAALNKKSGSYVAWSEDEGKTWKFKHLWGAQKRKINPELFGGASTLGYSVMRQSPNGLIHIICSDVHPMIHLCFNEAWLLAEETEEPDEKVLMAPGRTGELKKVQTCEEYYPNGKLKCRYRGGIAEDGRFLLDGRETFWYENGTVMQDGWYSMGRKSGEFSYYDENGNPVKRIFAQMKCGQYEEELTTFWENSGQIRTKTCYLNRKAEGKAAFFGRTGSLLEEGVFRCGKLNEGFGDLEK